MRNKTTLSTLKNLIVLMLLLVYYSGQGQFKLRIKIKNSKDSVAYFRACLFDDKNYIPKDTLKLKKSNFFINNKKSIVGGIYFLYFPQSKEKVFLAFRDQDSTRLELDGTNYLGLAKASDKKNQKFLDYQRLEKSFYVIDSLYDEEIKRGRKFSFANKAAFFREKTESLMAFRKEALKTLPSGDPLYLYFQTLNRLDASVPSRTNFKAREEFFTQTNWNDKQLLFTPGLKPLLQEYMNYFPLSGDSILRGVNRVMKTLDCKSRTYLFVLDHFGKLLQNRNIQNNVDVYLTYIKNYIQKDECKVVSAAVKKPYLKDLENLSQLKLDLPIVDMKLLDTSKVAQSIAEFAKKYDYTVIMFYDPDCDHCQKEVPEMDSTIKIIENRYNFKIGRYFIMNVPGLPAFKWKQFISKYKLDQNEVHVSIPEEGNIRTLFDAYTNPVFHLINQKTELKAKNISPVSIRRWFETSRK
jgi:hypothetical protein